MLYKFKSKAAGDVIMLEANGRRMLDIMGKQHGPTGIIEPGEMAAGIAAIERAIVEEEARLHQEMEDARISGHPAPRVEAVSLRQRAMPFLDMLRRCSEAGREIVWGV